MASTLSAQSTTFQPVAEYSLTQERSNLKGRFNLRYQTDLLERFTLVVGTNLQGDFEIMELNGGLM
jgi:hypothetical protein